MNPLHSEVVKRFLMSATHADLARLYSKRMECQVNVAQDGGSRVSGEFKGRQWHKWTDGSQTWASFRIPRDAKTNPVDNDSEIKFDITQHVEGIGMTGWDWQNRLSMWVAFDFDAITGHSERHGAKLSLEELDAVREAAEKIPWVSLRKSTSGKGLHLYVFLDPVQTQNHTEHAALARAILGKMSSLTGFDFGSNVDACGGNMWVWHRKMLNTDGLKLIKEGTVLTEIPVNWKDHVHVISGQRKRTRPSFVEGDDQPFNDLIGQNNKIPLDDVHKKLILWLEEKKAVAWWESDHHILVTHTVHLREAHEALGLKGIFETNAKGSEYGADHNCFCSPMRRGAWSVRRYSPGVTEHPSWTQDGAGWTRCFLNHDPDLATVSRSMGGVEHPSGGFVFREAGIAIEAVNKLGVNAQIPPFLSSRSAKIKTQKDGRLLVELEAKPTDSPRNGEMDQWLNEKQLWKRVFTFANQPDYELDVGNYDDLFRHLVMDDGSDGGWVIRRDGSWGLESGTNIKFALKSSGVNPKEIDAVMGASVLRPWKLVNRPFQPEFPGDREWNRDAAQFRFLPSENQDELSYPNWMKVLQHIGKSLDTAVAKSGWAQANGIVTGADYLKVWIASMFQHPFEPLPYLFLYSKTQDSGKSILHEALYLLLTKGHCRADAALMNEGGFNGELMGAVLCVVEETDLRKNKTAYSRIKDWVTGRQLPIHPKGKTPFSIPNTTHWIQCANERDACPVFPGDTRITMIHVSSLDPLEIIPKKKLLADLEREAPHFIAEVMRLELPEPASRLNVEVMVTEDKISAERSNRTALEEFMEDNCHAVDGKSIKLSDFYNRFCETLDGGDLSYWTKNKVSSFIDGKYPKGRNPADGQWHYGNISWEPRNPEEPILPRLVISDRQTLRPE